MTPAEFGKIIKNDIHGVFLFYGEEQYLKQYYFKMLQKTASPDESNIINISGDGNSLVDICQQIISIASIPSMDMSKRLVNIYDVEWKKVKEEHFSHLEDCINEIADYPDIIVILNTRPDNFDAGTDRKPSKLFAKLSKMVECVCFAKESPTRIAAWVQKHFAANKIKADANIANMIVKYCGRDMTTLNNEISKLSAYILQNNRDTVTQEDIHNISSFNNEIDTYDFSNAVLNGDSERAFSILSDMIMHKEAPEIIMGTLISIYADLYTVKTLLESGVVNSEISKTIGMHEYRAKIYISRASKLSKNGLEKAISLCGEADMKIKKSNLDNYKVIEVLLIKLFMTGKLR